MNKPFKPHPLVAEIIASLRDEPGEWQESASADARYRHFDRPGFMWVMTTGLTRSLIDRWHLRRAVRAWKRRA
jgi:hypothetical protein